VANPRSVGALAAICDKLPAASSEARRIYVSRSDAPRRRISHEDDLVERLAQRGFVSVRLGGLSAEQQVGLFRSAEIVIGPHGMGLTHIIASQELGRLIELFHPTAATDAYALIARAAGIDYDYVLGSAVQGTPQDYTIDVQQVLDLLGPDDAPAHRPAWRKAVNLIPASRTFRGFVPTGSSLLETHHQAMVWGQEARLHGIRGGATEVARWPHVLISPKNTYTVSCWIWIPETFNGEAVWVQFGEWPAQALRPADLRIRGRWQRVWSCAQAPNKDRCWVQLHIRGQTEAAIYSTCWQFEIGTEATSYVATG
jgi:hypothetical protein